MNFRLVKTYFDGFTPAHYPRPQGPHLNWYQDPTAASLSRVSRAAARTGRGCVSPAAASPTSATCPQSQPSLYCTVLYCTVLYCTVLYCTVPLLHQLHVPSASPHCHSPPQLTGDWRLRVTPPPPATTTLDT